MSTRQIFSAEMKKKVCKNTDCDWVEGPNDKHIGYDCPECGGKVGAKVGKFEYKREKLGPGQIKMELVRFIPNKKK